MQVSHVVLNPSEYRHHCFDHPNKSVNNSRWQVDFYMGNPDFADFPEEPEYFISTIHFTAYNLKKENRKEAYKRFVESLVMLAKFEGMRKTWGIKDKKDPFKFSEFDEIAAHDGLGAFIEFISGKRNPFVCLRIQPTIDAIRDYQYLFYSSLKLLSYPFGGAGVCGGVSAFHHIDEWTEFVTTPPKLVDQQQHGIY